MHRSLPFILAVLLASGASAQTPATPGGEYPGQSISLVNLSEFRPTSANWKIAGGATGDRNRALPLIGEPGTGVLVNTPSAGAREHLFTKWEHGDLDLSLDVMMPKGSNSGVYLMGRYEVQLFDSWGIRSPSFTDLGGIYQRWDEKRGVGREGYEGIPPRQNASRAPGLWQHLEISFRAPKFAGQQKIANARFLKVTVNGVVVHENVEVSGPTRAAPFLDERPLGPLMIQGDHGPVAVRNIQFKKYSGTVTIAGLRYKIFEGETMDSSYMTTHAPLREGNATGISVAPASGPDKFALRYDGTMTVPASGRYRFQLRLGWIGDDSATRGATVGGGTLVIGGTPALVHTGAERNSYADVTLAAGQHPFSLTFYRNRPFMGRREVALWVEGAGVERRTLHEEVIPNLGESVATIVVNAQTEPVVLRSFVRHGDTTRVLAVSVADPLGVHYTYDLAQAALLHVWRGPFLETTPMWHDRGESQLARPLGSALTLPGAPAFAFLTNATATWPASIDDERQFRRDGYLLDKTGHPTFLYHVRDVAVEDDIRPDSDGLSLRRELRLRAPSYAGGTDGLHLLLAQGERITRQDDGAYVVGDRSFYLLAGDGTAPVIRRQSGRDELLLPVRFERGEAKVTYTIVW